MKTILLPTDFSSNAWNAMQYAAQLFKEEVCKYILLNSYHIAPATVDMVSNAYTDLQEKTSEERLRVQLNELKELHHHADTWFETYSNYGEVLDEVQRMVLENKIDFIVMGTTGASGLKEAFMGTNTASVIQNATIPVLCVPEKSAFTGLKKVVFASDYQSIDDIQVLQPLKKIAQRNNSELSILKIQNPEKAMISIEEAEESFGLHGYFEEISHEFYTEQYDNIDDGILQFAHDNKTDLVALLKRKHPFWEKLLNKSITKQMAFHTDVPLLVLPG